VRIPADEVDAAASFVDVAVVHARVLKQLVGRSQAARVRAAIT
jgi:hypothetical protein